MSQPLFSPDRDRNKNKKCLVCNVAFKLSDNVLGFNAESWQSFKTNSEAWSKINVPLEDKFYQYTEVYSRYKDVKDPFGNLHNTCKLDIGGGNKYVRYLNKYGKKDDVITNEDSDNCDGNAVMTPVKSSPVKTRSNISVPTNSEEICFVCNEKGEDIRRCTDERGAALLNQRKDQYLEDKSHRFHEASYRLNVLLNRKSYDIFAEDVYYHRKCYLASCHPN